MPRVLRINHIGLATGSMDAALSVFRDGLGLEDKGGEYVESDAVRVSFLTLGESRLELLEPVGEEGPVQKFLANRGPGVHHVCLEVEDLPGMLERLKARGVELIDQEPRRGAHDTLVAFVHPKSANGVLVELVESSSLAGGHY
ncbi:MAG TPA: methylmalonyl-CoA epimerase [Chloroflexia bacterium]|nr:methylmalonyl-CoA epimerase [Chloroflexia bacterium]